jgi:hypothetical protein
MLLLGLYLAHDLLDAPLPQEALKRVRAIPNLLDLAGMSYDILFRETDERMNPFKLSHFHLSVLENGIDRLRYRSYLTRRMIDLNERDREFLVIPAPLSFLYYLIRPIRLTWEYGRAQGRLSKRK